MRDGLQLPLPQPHKQHLPLVAIPWVLPWESVSHYHTPLQQFLFYLVLMHLRRILVRFSKDMLKCLESSMCRS